MEALSYELELTHSRDQVWQMFTTSAGLARWLCLRANVEPRVGGAYELFWNPDQSRPESDSTIGCRVLSIDHPRLLSFTWRGADAVAETMNGPGITPTRVEVLLLPRPSGTRLVLVHSGWLDGDDWQRARDWFDRAWSGALERLPVVLAAAD